VAVLTAETDINAAYKDTIHVLSTKPPKGDKKVDTATVQEDYYQQSAKHLFLILAITDNCFLLCSVLMAWVLSNVSC